MQIKYALKKRLRENTLEIESWDEFLKFLKDSKNKIQGCIYRGQEDS